MSDAIVVGGGVDGLVCATWLARHGRSVTLLERRSVLGGLSARDEFHAGFFAPGVLHETRGLRPAVVDALKLGAHGLRRRASEPGTLLPLAGDAALWRLHDDDAMRTQLRTASSADVEAWTRWRKDVAALRPFVTGLLEAPAPDTEADSVGGLLGLLRTGFALRRLGRDAMRDLLRIGPMAVADWMRDTFADERLAVLLAGPALTGTVLGPWAAGTALNLLFAECVAGASVVGGPAGLVDALVSAARVAGVDLRTGQRVTDVLVHDDHATGVVLAGGAELAAPVVVLACDTVRALTSMLPRDVLDRRLRTRLSAWRARGSLARIDLAWDGAFDVPAARGMPVERALVGAATLDDLERVADALKYRRVAERPWLDVAVPSASDPRLAPAGKAVVSLLVHGVPQDVHGGWTDAARDALLRRVLDVLGEVVPGAARAGSRVLSARVLTPVDLAERYEITGGHVEHGEIALDQVLHLRPDPDLSRGVTPVGGLRVCGRAVHPGSVVPGMSGLLAARGLGR